MESSSTQTNIINEDSIVKDKKVKTSADRKKIKRASTGQDMESKLERLESEMTCSICQQVWFKPYSLHCQHVFCKSCIDDYRNHDVGSNSKCPVCRKPFIVRIGEINNCLSNIVDIFFSDKISERLAEERRSAIEEDERENVRRELMKKYQDEILGETISAVDEAVDEAEDEVGEEYVEVRRRGDGSLQSSRVGISGPFIMLKQSICNEVIDLKSSITPIDSIFNNQASKISGEVMIPYPSSREVENLPETQKSLAILLYISAALNKININFSTFVLLAIFINYALPVGGYELPNLLRTPLLLFTMLGTIFVIGSNFIETTQLHKFVKLMREDPVRVRAPFINNDFNPENIMRNIVNAVAAAAPIGQQLNTINPSIVRNTEISFRLVPDREHAE